MKKLNILARVLTLLIIAHVSVGQEALPNFLRFGPDKNDAQMPLADDTFVGPIPISATFPFFNVSYTSVFVSTNGVLSFGAGVTSYTPTRFPVNGMSCVSPYWSDIDVRNGGQIFYREVDDTQDLSEITNEIRRAFVEYFNFRPIFAFVVTYYNCAPYSGSISNRVTLQVIITTNGRHSFTIYNYNKLQWSNTGDADAQAGFNAGDGQVAFELPGSYTRDVMKLTNESNVNIPGKFIFKIDNEQITDGGCNQGGFMAIRPSFVSFIGDEDIEVTGPCFEMEDQVHIQFEKANDLSPAPCIVRDIFTAVCKTKLIGQIGQTRVNLTINNAKVFEGHIFVKDIQNSEHIDGLEPFYEFTDDSSDQLVQISWNRVTGLASEDQLVVVYSVVNEATGNASLVPFEVNIRPTDTEAWINLGEIRRGAQQRGLGGILKAIVGIAKKTRNGLKILKKLVSTQFVIRREQVFSNLCNNWAESQPDPQPILDSLPPCFRAVPNNDFRETIFEFTIDPACNPSSPKGCATFHPGAHSCYRSAAPSADYSGPGQQCCYNRDGQLLVGPPGGGTLDLAHSINWFQHFIKDVNPYFICCKLSDNCDIYYKYRPSDDGSKWRPPEPTGGSGDPHFLTLDGLSYTFNGFGEYVLLRVPTLQFEIQVRTLPFKGQGNTATEGTVFKAIVLKNQQDTVQVELTDSNQVYVYVNGAILNLEEEPIDSLSLSHTTLVMKDNTYSIICSNRFSIEVTVSSQKDALLFVATAPESFRGKTSGLLGVYDGNPNNDFTLPSGSVLTLDKNNDREIFEKFGKLWRTTNSTSIFGYMDGYEHASFVNDGYVPSFMSDGISFGNPSLESQARELCKDNAQCLFDVAITKDLKLGEMSVELTETVEKIKSESEAMEKTCVLLTSFANGKVEATKTPSGYEFDFKCDSSFCLEGSTKVKCANGTLDKVYPTCKTSCKSAGSQTLPGVLMLFLSLLTYLSILKA